MSERSHYEILGVDESASFEQIQQARNQLVKEQEGNQKRVTEIEAAFDAILMSRLRLRQEGKIKVPERIRFPERSAPEPPPEPQAPMTGRAPEWLAQFLDTPERSDILLPAAVLAVAALLSINSPPLALAIAVGASIYFLNRKENKLGRAFLISFVGLIVGVFLGSQIFALMATQLEQLSLATETAVAAFTCFVLWATSSFLR